MARSCRARLRRVRSPTALSGARRAGGPGARRRSAASNGLDRNPSAPASIARGSASRTRAVITTTLVSRMSGSRLIWRQTSKPSMPGMLRSSSSTSGRNVPTLRRPSKPFAAVSRRARGWDGAKRRHDHLGHVELVVHHEHAQRLAGARPEAMGLLEALELVRQDAEVPARRPERGELALLDPLLDRGGGNFKHFTYFTGRQVPLERASPGHGAIRRLTACGNSSSRAANRPPRFDDAHAGAE